MARGPRFLNRRVDPFEQVGFDRDQHDLDLFFRAAADELIIPHHFVDREWHVLLRLETDDALDFFFID